MENEEETIKTIKGFDHELKCRGKQYEVGQTIKADTWYTVENGKWKEVTEN